MQRLVDYNRDVQYVLSIMRKCIMVKEEDKEKTEK